jgi:hypothetical protein
MKKLMVLVLVACLTACGPATQITGSWKNPNQHAKKFNSVMVMTLTQNLEARQTVENDLAAALNANGIKTLKGMESIPPGFLDEKEFDKQALLEKIKKTGAEGIITITLINRETETRYVPGSYGYTPVTRFGYYGRFSGYYTTWYPTIYSPGYYEQNKIYFMEVNLYDAASEDLLWSAQSETYNPNSIAQFSKEFAEVIVNKMREDRVFSGMELSKR